MTRNFRSPCTDCSMPSRTSIGVHAVHLSFFEISIENRHLQHKTTERIIIACSVRALYNQSGSYAAFLSTSISIKKSQEKSHGQNLAIFLRFGKNFRLQLVVEFVADAPNGQNIFRGIRVRFNFFAQFSDKRHNITVIQ